MDTDVTMVAAGEASSSAAVMSGPSSSSTKPKRFEIKKWNAVALWAWGIILWICVLSVKLIKQVLQARSVLSHGVSAIMLFTFTALAAGLRPAKSAPLIIVNGSSRSMVISRGHPNNNR